MKRVLVATLLLGLDLSACRKDRFGELEKASVTVKVKYPSTYSQPMAGSASVTITSIDDASVKSATTNSNGEAAFTDVLPGNYNIAVSKSLTVEEAKPLTGFGTAISLNALQGNVTIANGQNPVYELTLQGSAAGNIVFKEVYYTGSKTSMGGTYFSDQFIELYNNATDTIYLDSLCIADAYGNAGLINPGSLPTPFNTDNSAVYVSSIWRITGTGKQHALAPGKSIIIAQDGVNHKDPLLNPNSPVDLSTAEWETYNERPDNRDVDAPAVPNLEKVYYNGGFDWNVPVFGAGLVIFKANFNTLEQVAIPGSTQPARIKIPNSIIIDGFEGLKDGGAGSFKRIPPAVDAGFVFADDTYNMQSFRRKTTTTINGRRVLQDTNNSGNDFEKIATPTPKKFE